MFKKRNIIFLCLLILGVLLIPGYGYGSPILPLTYNGSGNTGGTVPTDSSSPYEYGATVTVLNKGDLVKTGYTFVGWNTKSDGSGTDQAEGSIFTMGASDVTLFAKWTPSDTYSLRARGPAGGWIFYDKGSFSDGWRYLEAAPVSTEWTGKEWSIHGTLVGSTATAIGTGQRNTTTIVTWLNSKSETGRAAQLCDDLVEGNCSDWFLPSKDELNQMYVNLKEEGVGGFAGGHYWSSSGGSAYPAWKQRFDNGYQYSYSKGSTDKDRVRAIRAF